MIENKIDDHISIINLKSDADYMFEELGYKKSICEDGNSEEFINGKRNINFYYECKEVGIKQYSITMLELKAIYKKCEEMKWL
jgi:hypothetical protein